MNSSPFNASIPNNGRSVKCMVFNTTTITHLFGGPSPEYSIPFSVCTYNCSCVLNVYKKSSWGTVRAKNVGTSICTSPTCNNVEFNECVSPEQY